MNPKYHLLIAVAALSLGACSTDDTYPEPVPENEGRKISFTVAEDTETRTTLEKLEAGNFLRWVSTDKVGIYTAGQSVNSNIETTADVKKSPVEFVGTLEQQVSPGDMFYAYYPYNAEQTTDPAAVKLSIPAEQSQTKAGVYNGESHPLVAVPMEFSQEWGNAGRMSSVRFRQLGSIVELQLYSSDETLRSEKIRSVTFESEAPLAGDFTFDLTNVTVKEALPISGYESNKATTSLEAPAAIPAAKDKAARVYLTIAPGQYTGQIVVRTDVAKYTFRLKNAMDFGRAAIKALPANLAKAERDIFILFEDPETKRICVENWDTDGDNELSYKEAAAVTDLEGKFTYSNITSFNELRYFTGLQSIGENHFFCCSLTSIVIPEGVTEIKNYAFDQCSKLTSIQLPDGLTKIGHSAFNKCKSLTDIDIPDGVTSIQYRTFNECNSLTSINMPDGVTAIGVEAFYYCNSLKNFHLPDKLTSIGYRAFERCSGLTSIDIPDGVTSIGYAAFVGCSMTSITIPGGVTTIEESTFFDCTNLTSVYTSNGLTTIGRRAFDGCTKLTSIQLPDGLTTIGEGAFNECSSLTSIHLPDGLTTIGERAFRSCSSLTSINLPDGLTTIGECAFLACSSLTDIITIPQTVSSIGKQAFAGCSSLSTFKGKYASADDRSLIKDGVLLAFARAGLIAYEIPDGVTAIEYGAFGGCSNLKSILIPKTVTAIGESAFYNCSNLINFYCKPTAPPTLGYNALYNTPSSMKIYVWEASVDAYKTAGGYWEDHVSQIAAHSFVFND